MFIKDWKKAWKLHSVQVAATGAAAAELFNQLPVEQQTALLAVLHVSPTRLVLFGFVCVLVARLKKQS